MNIVARDKFYGVVERHFHKLTPGQRNGFEHLLTAFSVVLDMRFAAYMLATAWHETWYKMEPISELGGETYLKSKPYFPYYGRGFVQLTWKANYERYGIADHPEKALDLTMASHILIDGMTNGIFTGRKLDHYFNKTVNDPLNARRVINGIDKASQIAGHYLVFKAALNAGSVGTTKLTIVPKPT